METARTAEREDNRWFAPADRTAPSRAFDDVTRVTGEPEPLINIEVLPPILPRPAQLTANESRDVRFSELKAIIGELRAVLRDSWDMLDAEVDSVEWQLRERIAKL